MDSIRSSSAHNVQPSSPNPTQPTQTASGAHGSEDPKPLTSAMLSTHAVTALNAKETQGNEQEKMLAGRAKGAMRDLQLKLSSNQPANGNTRFEQHDDQGVLAIEAKLNESSEYDVLSVEYKRDSKATVSMTLPSPSRTVAHNTPRPSALLGLSNELLFKIAGETAEDGGKGLNFNLRLVSKDMKIIADDQMSPEQRFITENRQTLETSGHKRRAVLSLAGESKDIQNFVVTHGKTLQASEHKPYDMWTLASRSEDIQNFVVRHVRTLDALGYTPHSMKSLASGSQDIRNFVVTHGPKLGALGHSPHSISLLAGESEDIRNFVVMHCESLQASGHTLPDMVLLAGRPEDERNAVLQPISHPN
jgi:hypothetical protein